MRIFTHSANYYAHNVGRALPAAKPYASVGDVHPTVKSTHSIRGPLPFKVFSWPSPPYPISAGASGKSWKSSIAADAPRPAKSTAISRIPPVTPPSARCSRCWRKRGISAHESDGPRYVYFPCISTEKAKRSAIEQLLRTFFNNSASSAMAALLDMSSANLSEAEVTRLARLIQQAKRTRRKAMTQLVEVVRRLGPEGGGTASVLEILVRVTALLIVGVLVALALRRASAALRHLVWTLSLLGTLLVPFCYWAFPAWQWAILPARMKLPGHRSQRLRKTPRRKPRFTSPILPARPYANLPRLRPCAGNRGGTFPGHCPADHRRHRDDSAFHRISGRPTDVALAGALCLVLGPGDPLGFGVAGDRHCGGLARCPVGPTGRGLALASDSAAIARSVRLPPAGGSAAVRATVDSDDLGAAAAR